MTGQEQIQRRPAMEATVIAASAKKVVRAGLEVGDAFLAHFSKDAEEIRHAKQLSDSLAQIDKP